MPITLRSTSGLALAVLTALATAAALAGPAAAAPAPAFAPTNDTEYVIPSALGFNPHPYVPSSTASARSTGGQTSTSPTPASTSVTLPLYTGTAPDGSSVGYIITESSDANDSTSLRVNYAQKLANARGTAAVQAVSGSSTALHFTGSVDFAAARRAVTPGAAPNYFPPSAFTAGNTADARYSPLTTTGNGIVRNTPVVTNRTGWSDSVISIDTSAHTVTLHLFGGFYQGRQILYIPAESSSQLISAIESSTYAPNLAAAPGLAGDDPATSAREAIVPIVNGPLAASGQRQGLNSALKGEGPPLNIIQEEPSPPSDGPSNYSPVWDITPALWTRTTDLPVVTDIASVPSLVSSGQFVSYANGPRNNEVGLNASRDVSLCPVIVVFNGDPTS